MWLSALGMLAMYGADADPDESAPHPELVAVFGSEKSIPIANGYVFMQDAYIPPPYLVERRGLDIYINNRFFVPGPNWVAPGSVAEPEHRDPGDPPPGSHPDDETPKSTLDYWDAEVFYVGNHFTPDIAAKKLAEAIAKADPHTKTRIVIAEDKASSAVYWTVNGKESCTTIEPWHLKLPASRPKDKVLSEAKSIMQGYVSDLTNGHILIAYPGGSQIGIGGKEVSDFVHILVSEASPSEKMIKLESAGLYKPTDGMLTEFLKTVAITPDLISRVAALKPEEPSPTHGYTPPKLPPLPESAPEKSAPHPEDATSLPHALTSDSRKIPGRSAPDATSGGGSPTAPRRRRERGRAQYHDLFMTRSPPNVRDIAGRSPSSDSRAAKHFARSRPLLGCIVMTRQAGASP